MSPKDNNKQVSAAVRILHQKRDASARATHLKAENWIVQSSTIERKIMSTKTSFKRIALVAVSALALGGFSVISAPQASADASSFILTKDTLGGNGVALSSSKYTAATVLDTRGISAFTVNPGDTVTLKFGVMGTGATVTATDSLTATMTGYGNLFTNETITGGISGTTGTLFRVGISGAVGQADVAGDQDFTATTTPGTYPIVFTLTNHTAAGVATTSQSITVTMTVAAPTAFSAQLSTSFVGASGTTETADAEIRTSSVATTAGATIAVALKNTSGSAYTGGGTFDVSVVSGPGLVNATSTVTYAAATARADTLAIASGTSTAWVQTTADGTSGTTVIRIKLLDATTGASLGTIAEETVYWYGTVATLTATKVFSVAKASSTAIGCVSATACDQADVAGTPFIVIKAEDANGALVPGLTVSAVISDSTIIGSSAIVAVTQGTKSAADAATACVTTDCNGLGYYNASVAGATGAASGKSATITYRTLLTGTTYVTAAAVTVTIGGAIATETLSLDKSSYEPGDAMIVSRIAKDASGNTPYDGQTAGEVTFNKPVSGTVGDSWYVSGSKVTSATAPSIYAPAASGAFIAKMTASVDGTTQLTATAEVAGDQSASLALDAANAATDAANNAYDEAQNATQAASDALAAVTALAAQVESLIASVKKLTAAVAKLNKKK